MLAETEMEVAEQSVLWEVFPNMEPWIVDAVYYSMACGADRMERCIRALGEMQGPQPASPVPALAPESLRSTPRQQRAPTQLANTSMSTLGQSLSLLLDRPPSSPSSSLPTQITSPPATPRQSPSLPCVANMPLPEFLRSTVPSEVSWVSGVKAESASTDFRFDPTKMAAGLRLDHDALTVEQVNSAATHKIAILTKGFTAGRLYFEFVILEAGTNRHVMIGVTDGSQANMLTSSFYPGSATDKGVSYGAHNGNRHFSNTTATYGPTASKGDKIGVLLNCDFGTVSFFKNGASLGAALGADVYRVGATYYPAVTLYELGQKVGVCGFAADR